MISKDESSIEYVEDRKGHDFRYSLDGNKLGKMGWQPKYDFDTALEQTVKWYVENRWWWEPLKR
jgi:dTDP-glucose 4,6-dehydratase